MEKYGKILSDYNTIRELMGESFDANKGYYVIEEKVDGSQIRGEILSDGSMMAGSKTVDFTEANPAQKDFRLGQEKMIEALKKVAYLEEHIQLFGEYLRQPRHNSIHYERVPKNNIYLFDAKVNGRWLNEKELIKLANIVELEPVCIINKMDRMPNMEDLQPYLAAGSFLGGQREGVVIKNRQKTYLYYSNLQFFTMKVVNEQFKELNKKVWETEKRAGVRSIQDLIDTVVSGVGIQALWNKSIQHLRDEGKSTYSMKDIPALISLIEKDVDEELKTVLMNALYEQTHRFLLRKITSGFPVYYKEKLVNDISEQINQEH